MNNKERIKFMRDTLNKSLDTRKAHTILLLRPFYLDCARLRAMNNYLSGIENSETQKKLIYEMLKPSVMIGSKTYNFNNNNELIGKKNKTINSDEENNGDE
jgi:hypothetical protein